MSACHHISFAADEREQQLHVELAETRAALEREIAARMRLEKAAVEAVENEQRRVARLLHNTICQRLAGSHLITRVLMRKLRDISPELAQEFTELDESLHSAVGEIHDLIQWLQPAMFSAPVLVTALAELARAASRKIPCEFHCPEPVVVSDDGASEQLLKIAHQAISEALGCPDAQKILVSLSSDNRCILLSVQHSGQLNPASSRNWQNNSHELLRRRADMIGATLTISSEAGQGTTIQCELPQT